MNRFSTNYNKDLRNPATRVRRQADFLDLMLVAFFSHFLMVSFTGFLKLGFYRLDYLYGARIMARTLDLYPLVFLTTYFAYFFVSLYLSNGRTLSYFALNLYTIPRQQRDLSIKTCFLRASAYTIPIGLFGINPLIGILAFFTFYRPIKFLKLSKPLVDVISDCSVYEFEKEDLGRHQNLSDSEPILLSDSSSFAIELPDLTEQDQAVAGDNIIELPSRTIEEEDKKQAA